ncbi:MAG: SAM-dependent methyltransferase [Algicola sp.]|nr:SAM-dependent methyltransferase [Algicola sp.]
MRKPDNAKQALAAFARQKPPLTVVTQQNQQAQDTQTQWQIAPLSSAPQDSPLEGINPDSLTFVPFSRSPLWQKQTDYFMSQGPAAWQNGQVPHYITNTPTLVNAWARLVVNYLLDGLHNGAIDPEQPIKLLELGAGSGRFAIQMLQQLEQLFKQYGLAELDFCYLVSDISDKNRQFIAEHPYMQSYLESGRAKVLGFDALYTANADTSKELGGTNPLMVVANYLFDSLPQELVYLHYGELYQGEIALGNSAENQPDKNSEDTPFKDLSLYYRWQKQPELAHWLETQPPQLRDFLAQQLARDLSQLDSQPLLLPVGALRCLARLQQLAPQGLLLMSADFGQKDQQAVRKMQMPELRAHGSFSLPVNFACSNHWLAAQDGQIRTVQQRSDGLLFNLAILPADESENRAYAMTQQACDQWLSDYDPDDFFQIKRSLHGAQEVLTEAQQQAYLRLSRYDPKVLALFLPLLLKHGVQIEARLDWCELLSKVWQNYVPIGERNEQGEFAFRLGLLAVDLSHWALAQACFVSCLHWYGDSTAIWHNLALVAHVTGDSQLADQSIELALKLTPDDEQARQLADDIKTAQRSCEQLFWFDNDAAKIHREQQLILQPLAGHYAGEFYLQYRDPQIAQLARSYQLETPEQVKEAIEGWQQHDSRASYAVVHQVYGLVGCVGLDFHRDQSEKPDKPGNPSKLGNTTSSATFSFWIGVDYQNLGFGQLAAQLMVAQAKVLCAQQGLQYLLTSAWQHNDRSLHVLNKVGFVDLALTHGEGEAIEHYLYMPLATNVPAAQLQAQARDRVVKQLQQTRETTHQTSQQKQGQLNDK